MIVAMSLLITGALCAALLLAVVPLAHAAPPDPGLAAEIERFGTDDDALARFYAVPRSEAARARREQLLLGWEAHLAALPFDRLSPSAKIDWLLLRGHLTHERATLAFAHRREQETAPLLPFAETIVALEEARAAMRPIEPERAAADLARLTQAIIAAKKALGEKTVKPEPTPSLALRAAGQVGALRSTLAGWFTYYDGYRPIFSWWCRTPYGAARDALEGYEKALREEIAGAKGKDDDPLIGDPIGRDALLADLAYERVPYTPEELVAIAEREFAWCEAEMKTAARAMGKGDDWKAALEMVKNEHVPPGEQDVLVERQARDAIAFVTKRDLVTIEPLCAETWRIEMLSQETQRVLPFAAYGGQKMLVSYPLEGMDDATKRMSLRGNNIHFTRIVTPHELIPGHHLQSYMADRYRAYRQRFSTPFLVEGWALHWEMELWDRGYAESPQNRIGMLFWRMHRCARIIVSLGFHLGTMTPPKMIEFLVERVGHERFTATSEVRRFIGGAYSPLYQCAYMIGGLQLRALENELVGQKGWSPKRFHDAVLHEGAIPIDLIDAALTGRALTRDSPPKRTRDL
jgi:uncharacterized protein (DUF885 family)